MNSKWFYTIIMLSILYVILQKFLLCTWRSGLTWCPVSYLIIIKRRNKGDREEERKKGNPGSFLQMYLLLLLLPQISSLWLSNVNTYWQSNQGIILLFCFKKYKWDFVGWIEIFGYFKEQGREKRYIYLYSNPGYS